MTARSKRVRCDRCRERWATQLVEFRSSAQSPATQRFWRCEGCAALAEADLADFKAVQRAQPERQQEWMVRYADGLGVFVEALTAPTGHDQARLHEPAPRLKKAKEAQL
jgi:hypothetical protein